MSSVIFAADSTAIEDRYPEAPARAALPAKERASLLRRVHGVAAGVLFLAARVPVYVAVLLFGALVSLLGAMLYPIQAVGLRLSRPAGAVTAAALALVCIAAPQRARADTITDTSLLQQTTLVFGTDQKNLYSFDAPGAGTLSVTLKDWEFPEPLQQLTASIMSQGQTWSLTPSQNSEWLLDLPIQTGGVFGAFVDAKPGTLDGFQFGGYTLNVDFQATPVPLPPALDLLLGGMGLLGAVSLFERISRRRNGDVISVA